MSCIVPDDDRAPPTGPDHRMPAVPGAHVAYARGAELVVEWYDFGPHAPYESANLLIFDAAAQRQFAVILGIEEYTGSDVLAAQIAGRFESYFRVKGFAEEHAIPFIAEVDFEP